MCPLQTILKSSTCFNLRLEPNITHSVLPRCKDSLLSTSQDEHDSNKFPSLEEITLRSLWVFLHYHQQLFEHV